MCVTSQQTQLSLGFKVNNKKQDYGSCGSTNRRTDTPPFALHVVCPSQSGVLNSESAHTRTDFDMAVDTLR